MATFHVTWAQRVILVGVLWASVPLDARGQPFPSEDLPTAVQRSVYLSKGPVDEATDLFVAGGVVTTLRLPTAADANRTKLLGWEGRFEPLLVGGKTLVIVPLRDLAPADRFMMLVTLEDGTEIPFTVTAAKSQADGQVNVFLDPESPTALRWELEAKRKEVDSLRAEYRRQREEGTSVDHALAALLARNKVALTPFGECNAWLLNQGDVTVEITLFASKGKKETRRKAAVVFKITNKNPVKPWVLQEARLTTWRTQEEKPFALRATSSTIAPGETSRIAVVADFSSFDEKKNSEKLVLELFRDGGLRQSYVELVPQDFR